MITNIGLYGAICALTATQLCKAAVLSSSKLETCLNDGSEELDCDKKVVLTISLEHGSQQTERAEFLIEEVLDDSNVAMQLQKPWRVTWTKTPAFWRYPLAYIQDVNNKPAEQIIQVGWLACEDNPMAADSEQTCGVATLAGERVIDSEGFCCSCDAGDVISGTPTRANLDCNIFALSESAHCLAWDSLWYSIFDVDRPQVFYDITVTIARPVDPEASWETVTYTEEQLQLNHQQPVAATSGGQLRVELVGDLATAVEPHRFDSDYLAIPSRPSDHPRVNLLRPLEHAMLIEKSLFDLSGVACDKIGVSYTAFKHQANGCDRPPNSCLANQLDDLHAEDTDRLAAGSASRYLVSGFCEGAVDLGVQQDGVSGETRFLACPMTQRHTTLMRLEAVAQDVMFVKNVASGRIVHAYVDAFEALTGEGEAEVQIVSTGKVVADFSLGVTNCTGGFEASPAVSIALHPYETGSRKFDVFASHTGGGEYTCVAKLFNSLGDLADSKVIYFNVSSLQLTNGAQAGNTRSATDNDGWFIGPSDCTALCPSVLDLPCAFAHSCWSRLFAFIFVAGITLCCCFACCKANLAKKSLLWLSGQGTQHRAQQQPGIVVHTGTPPIQVVGGQPSLHPVVQGRPLGYGVATSPIQPNALQTDAKGRPIAIDGFPMPTSHMQHDTRGRPVAVDGFPMPTTHDANPDAYAMQYAMHPSENRKQDFQGRRYR
mmetsp:Transcript_2206/g.5616  ORF Transcript_2206/g.5616 Transcript_2206/m.5616 type:complete len:714 (+) Transcript_2206:43-2184(+)